MGNQIIDTELKLINLIVSWLKSARRIVRYFAALLLVTFAVHAIPAAQASEFLSFSDCSIYAIGTLKHRIFDANGKLHPIILSRDILHLSGCEGGGQQTVFARIEGKLKQKYVLEYRQITIKSDGTSNLARAALDACEQQSNCIAEVYRLKTYPAPSVIPFAKSGGLPFAAFLGHIGTAGHFEITRRGTLAMSSVMGIMWSAQALEILQDASRDADFYEWSNPSAHAQTANNDQTGKFDQSQAEAAPSNFESWSVTHLSAAAVACKENRTRDALYLLGYSIHGIQDLVFHEGITNAEHSFRDNIEDEQIDAKKNSPHNHYDEKMQLASEATMNLLLGFKNRITSVSTVCWDNMVSYSSNSRLSTHEKEVLLGKSGKDFGVLAYFKYYALATTVRDAIVENNSKQENFFIPVHWLGDRQRQPLDGFISRIIANIPN